MHCNDIRQLLDAYIDGELSDAQMRSIQEHAKACKTCRDELDAAMLLKDTLAHMDDDLSVPLQAQAAWRSAVRREAANQRKKKWMRYASAAAAVCVLALGIGVVMEPQFAPEQTVMPRMISAENADFAMVASDGMQEAAGTANLQPQCTVKRKISASSASEAFKKLDLLAQEYSGSFDQEAENACRIEIPAEYLDDFTKAASRIGEELYSETIGEAIGTAVIQIQVAEE